MKIHSHSIWYLKQVFFHYYLFIHIRCSGYPQIRLSEKWPSPERRSPREKLAGPICRRNMYVQYIHTLFNKIKCYSCMIYYNENSILSLVIHAVMEVQTLPRKTPLSQWVIHCLFRIDCHIQNHQRSIWLLMIFFLVLNLF